MMPKLDGYGVCQELRKESDVPIVMLTALGDVADRITGLELGADDYVVKPFSPKELEARIRCVLRRVEKEQVAGIPNSGVIQVSDLRIDTNKRQVFRGDERIRLTGMEFSLFGTAGEPFRRAVQPRRNPQRGVGLHPGAPCGHPGGGCSYLPSALQIGG